MLTHLIQQKNRRRSRPRPRQLVVVWVIAVVTFLAASCGKPFNVKPKTALPPPKFDAVARSGVIEIQAEPITDEDLLYHVFDANLVMAGLFPVRVLIANTGSAPLSIKKASFSVASPDGTLYRPVNGARAFSQLIRYYEIQNYQKFGYRQSRDDFLSYSLDVNAPLTPGEQRSGLLFFAVPPERAREHGFSLVVKRIESGDVKTGSEVKLKLN